MIESFYVLSPIMYQKDVDTGFILPLISTMSLQTVHHHHHFICEETEAPRD